MNKPTASTNRKKKESLLKEIGFAIVEIFAGSIVTKVGLSIVLAVVGVVFIFSPIVGQPEKPIAFYILGAIFLALGASLLISRAIEIRKENNR